MTLFEEMIKPFVMELLRVAMIAVVPIAIVALESNQIDWKALAIIAAVAVLKAIDRSLNESEIVKKGIVRF